MSQQSELWLSDLMDQQYGAGQWTQRTGVGQGTDIGPALQLGLQALRVQGSGRGKIKIDSGGWLMTIPPGPALLSGNYLEGEGSQASVIFYNQPSSAAFWFSGAGGYTGGGLRGLGVVLERGMGASNAYGILLQGDAVFQPDQTEFEDIYLTAQNNDYWFTGFEAYGNARVSPQGIRIAKLENVQVFNCRNAGFYLSNVVGWTLNGIGAFVGAGGGNNIYVTGGGSGPTNSVHVQGENVIGTLVVNNCSDVVLNGTRYA